MRARMEDNRDVCKVSESTVRNKVVRARGSKMKYGREYLVLLKELNREG